MSHIVQIQAEVRDPGGRGGLPPARPARARPRHRHPLRGPGRRPARQAARLALPGRLRHRHRGGPLRQLRGPGASRRTSTASSRRYAVEKARIEARKRGHSVAEQTLSDGSIEVTIQLGGAA